jgi:DNA (cytosine-5)-methyltransferase 1
MAHMTRVGSLFTGYGGLDAAVRSVLGGDLAWVSDNHPSAVKLLAHRHPDVSNLGDITAIDWTTVAPVDVLTAGFPCQDISNAGRRAGIEGERSGLWSYVVDAIRVVRPRLVVLENVSALVVRGLDRVLADLAAIGFDAEWTTLRASDVGAPHRRERWFAVAVPSVARGVAPNPAGDGRDEGRAAPARLVGGLDAALSGGNAPAHAHGAGREGIEPARGHDLPARGAATDTTSSGRRRALPVTPGATQGAELEAGGRAVGRGGGASAVAWGDYEPAIRRWEATLGRPAPAPTEPGRRGQPVLSPDFVEWLMGVDVGFVTGVPGLSRNDMLRLLGNGVVPQQGAIAVDYLLDQFEEVRCA